MATIWVDADACPVAAREVLFKASQRTKMPLILVANHFIRTPPPSHIQCKVVESGFDVADDYIAQQCQPSDLVVTSDIPLAAEVLAKGTSAINNRGEAYSRETIGSRLNIRDFMDTMRASGEHGGGQKAYSAKDKQGFANALDRWLATAT